MEKIKRKIKLFINRVIARTSPYIIYIEEDNNKLLAEYRKRIKF